MQHQTQPPRRQGPQPFLHAYNFVPLEKTPPDRKEYRAHNGLDRTATVYSGALRCRLTAITPIFVGGKRESTETRGHNLVHFYALNGRPAFPPTSLKGVVRSVFEAATNSCLSIFDGGAVQKRDPKGDWARHLQRGRLERQDDGKWKVRVMATAWVRQHRANRFADGEAVEAIIDPEVNLGRRGQIHWSCETLGVFREGDAIPPLRGGQIRVAGFLKKNGVPLLSPGSPPSRKHDERVFFELTDLNIECLPVDALRRDGALRRDCEAANPRVGTNLAVDDEVVRRYERVKADQYAAYAKAKEAGEYRDDIAFQPDVRDGELVYFQHENGVVQQISRTGWPRFEMKTTRADVAGHHVSCTSLLELCPACRLFGMVQVRPSSSEKQPAAALAGRVFFSHGLLASAHDGASEEKILPILAGPKPTASEFYLKANAGARYGYVDWIDASPRSARVRGRKFYRHGQPQFVDERNSQNVSATLLTGDPAGHAFEFSVRFEDLDAAELGALVWALSPYDRDGTRLAHKVGMGKPVGLGSCKIEILWDSRSPDDTVSDPHMFTHVVGPRRYTSLSISGRADGEEARHELDQCCSAWLQTRPPAALSELCEMLTWRPNTTTSYPKLPGGDGGHEWFKAAARMHVLPSPTEEAAGTRLTSPPG